MKYVFVIAGKNVKTHHALTLSLSMIFTWPIYPSITSPHAPTDAPALKISAQSPTQSLWRHQNGMS